MDYFSVKNFTKFQHYKDRTPPWIKLYNELLDDYEFGRLPDASKAHLVAIWLLASRYENKVPFDPEWVGRRINATDPVDLVLLSDRGFIVIDQPCSKLLADCKQTAMPEREGEKEKEVEEDKKPTSAKADLGDAYQLWNDLAEEVGLPTCRKVDGPTSQALSKRLTDHGPGGFLSALNGIRGSPHHRGENGWRADLPWLVKKSNFEKMMLKGEHYGKTGDTERAPSRGSAAINALAEIISEDRAVHRNSGAHQSQNTPRAIGNR